MTMRDIYTATRITYGYGCHSFQFERKGDAVYHPMYGTSPIRLVPNQVRTLANWLNRAADDAERAQRGAKR